MTPQTPDPKDAEMKKISLVPGFKECATPSISTRRRER
jgi:hypothetical protein